MKQALKIYLDTHPLVNAILIGTRKTDPYGDKMTSMQPTDGDWPFVMRIHPILEWSFKDIWNALLYLKIPYCILYDEGYLQYMTFSFTSLGSTSTTNPNPYLVNPSQPCGYDPAYYLADEGQERAGRT